MLVSDFNFELPSELIASYPLENRSASRLLKLNGDVGTCEHLQFKQIVELLNPGDLLILNDTRVLAARLFGHKASGGKVELLIERCLSETTALAHIKASNAPIKGTILHLTDDVELIVEGREDDLFYLRVIRGDNLYTLMDKLGELPIPHYLGRKVASVDSQRYQTVYAKHPGAVAAPTAGLHFDDAIMQELRHKNIQMAYVTLHVGAGTFKPVRVDHVYDHVMHAEHLTVSPETCKKIEETQSRGGRIVAVGTTSVRSLETAAQTGKILPYQGESRLFIYPGYQFKLVDVMITNFHLPQSTLLMLVCAFAGYEETMRAYHQAMQHQYRFFSYGDAMFVTRKKIV